MSSPRVPAPLSMKPKVFCLCVFLGSMVPGSSRAQPQAARAGAPLPGAGGETSALAARIRRAEYDFSPVHAETSAWSAPNRAQELRSRVSLDGLEVFPRAS